MASQRTKVRLGKATALWLWTSVGLAACGVREVSLDPHALDADSDDSGVSGGASPTASTSRNSTAGRSQSGGAAGNVNGVGATIVGGSWSIAAGGFPASAGASTVGDGSLTNGGVALGGSDPPTQGGANTDTDSPAASGAGGNVAVPSDSTSPLVVGGAGGSLAMGGSSAAPQGGTIAGANSLPTAGGNVAQGGTYSSSGCTSGTCGGVVVSGSAGTAGREATAGASGSVAGGGSAGNSGRNSGSAGTSSVGPGIVGLPESKCSTSESGGSARFTFSLATKPTANVNLGFVSSDVTEGTVSSDWLVFTPSNWNVPQQLTVSGVSDLSLDGNVDYQVKVTVSSADPSYAALSPLPIALVNVDSYSVFHGLGDLSGGANDSGAMDVSGDGNVVVGYGTADSGSLAVRWTPNEGMVSLVNGSPGGRAEGISPNGTMIVGSVTVTDSTWYGGRAAMIWRYGAPGERFGSATCNKDGGMMQCFSSAYAVTDSGIAVGEALSISSTPAPVGYRWDGTSGTGLSSMSVVYAVSADGLVAAGVRLRAPRLSNPVSAIRATESLGYPVDATCITPQLGDCTSMARGISADGSVVVGENFAPPPYASSGGITTGFVWTASERMIRLPDLPFGVEDGAAYDINANATAGGNSVIVGSGTDEAGARRAMVWINRYPRTVEYFFSGIPAGWKLTLARAVSANGRVIVGEGINPAGQKEAWRAILPEPALK